MTVAVFVTKESDAACLVPWGVRFAHADHTELLIVCPRRSKGKTDWRPLEVGQSEDNKLHRAIFEQLKQEDPQHVVLKQDIASGVESTDLDRVAIEIQELVSPTPEVSFVEKVGDLDISLLLLPAYETSKDSANQKQTWQQQLAAQAPCEVVTISGPPPAASSPIHVLVACQGETSADDALALGRACQLAKNIDGGEVTLLYVRPDDDDVASQVGLRHIGQLSKTVSEKKVNLTTQVVLADSLCDGINQAAFGSVDLVLAGTRNPKTIRALFRDCGSSGEAKIPSTACIRESVPLTDQVWSRFRAGVRRYVPQLDRELRVSIVDRLQSNSKFDFDFVALISLSTLIAALGLARDSGAVVIGAMLVAPLMTPLMAIGFALVQGNEKLIRGALKSVALGFSVALLIGVLVGGTLGIIAPHFPISGQMFARGMPNLLDLAIALASGIAGAYAMSRANLMSALPGVAIAAALVPPIATSGLALTMGDFELSFGALLLFFTNIVAIVLGTAGTFWAVGISTHVRQDRPQQVWPRYWFLGFVIVSFLLAAWMSIFNRLEPESNSQIEGKIGNVERVDMNRN